MKANDRVRQRAPRTLALHKETLRRLSAASLGPVAGGGPLTPICSADARCMSMDAGCMSLTCPPYNCGP